MVSILKTPIKRVLAVRLDEGDDLIPAVKRIAIDQGIKSRFFYALGAMSKVYSVYSLEKNAYVNMEERGFFEITSCIGDIAEIVDDEGKQVDAFVHAHITFSGKDGFSHRGHLQTGVSIKPVVEAIIFELDKPIGRLRTELEKQGYSLPRF